VWSGAQAQQVDTETIPAPASAPASAPAMIELNFPENMELKVLIDYVGKRQGINFVYDEQIGNKKVTIKAPLKVPAESLMALLESALTMKSLSMSRCDVPDTIKIEVAKTLTSVASLHTTSQESSDSPLTLAMTRVFELKHTTPQQVDLVVKPFLASPTANITVLTEHDMVIVTDFTTNMKRVAELIAIIDRPRRQVQVRFVAVKRVEAAALAPKVMQLIAGKSKARGVAAGAKDAASDVTVLADERTNQLVIVGEAAPVAETLSLIESLDVSLGLETKTYTLTSASPERVDRLVKELIGDANAKRLYKSAIDREANLLIVTATPEIHEQIETVRQTLDKPIADAQSPIRFYKLENAKASEVLLTLQNIEGDNGLNNISIDGVATDAKPAAEKELIIAGPTAGQINSLPDGMSSDLMGPNRPKTARTDSSRETRVMADEASNMIIVVAKPAMHPVYEKLIKRLDTRRPQVLIEATIVTIDTTNDFALGVEIGKRGTFDSGNGRYLTFNSFGLTDVDKSTGALTLKPGVGFNGAMFSSDIADVVVRALASDSRAKVFSRPSVLVNDNAKGTLVSENEEPFSSVNASSTVATTSLGGYASAGTNIIIKPQISEGEHLKLEYEVTLSSFGEQKNESLPPPRQRNTLTSIVTIPDGNTIVVGGLTREYTSQTVQRMPGLGQLPGLEFLFSSRTTEKRKSTLFVFIRAVILRDDKFKDLKVLSRSALASSELPGDYPISEPVEIR